MAAPPVPVSATLAVPTARPTPTVRRMLYLIGTAVWVTGVLYWTFDKYMLRHTDIGLSENPLQVWWLRLHAATATAVVWLFGYLCAIHVQRNWRGGLRRSSGALFVSVLSVLTLTGYLIYYVEADRPLAVLAQLHWVVGLCAPLAFLLHRGVRRRLGVARPAVVAVATGSESSAVQLGPVAPVVGEAVASVAPASSPRLLQ